MATKKTPVTGVKARKSRKRSEPDDFDLIFDKIDTNNDGRISVLELTKAAKDLGYNYTKKQAENMIRDVCPKEPGYVNRREFKKLFYDRQAVLDKEASRLKEAFSAFDKDGNGTISADEIRQVMRSCGEQLDEDALNEIMKQVDVDGDGMISIEEFAQVMSELED